MRIQIMALVILVSGTSLWGAPAQAQGLFYDSCVHSADLERESFIHTVALWNTNTSGGMMGMSCRDLRQITETAQIVELVLYPATLALVLSPMKAELMASLAQLGLTMANPAVLGVTVIGATGAVVFYLILRQTMEECARLDREQLRAAILEEVGQKYGLPGTAVDLKLVGE